MDTIFSVSSLLTMPFWLLMMFAPRWRVTRRVLGSVWVIVPAGLLYTLLVLPSITTIFPAVANPTLVGIQALLGQPDGATIAWVHFLAFDLFVGRWAYLDNQRVGLHPLLMGPILFLTLMLGPAGFVTYLVARAIRERVGEPAGDLVVANE